MVIIRSVVFLPDCAAISSSLSSKRYLGDSGQKGRVASWKMAGMEVMASNRGQPSSVPSTLFMPSTWERRMERVMISWYTVPSYRSIS